MAGGSSYQGFELTGVNCNNKRGWGHSILSQYLFAMFFFFVSLLLTYLNPYKIDKDNQKLLEIKSCSVKEHKKLEEKSGEIPKDNLETHTVQGSVVRLMNNTRSCLDKLVKKGG